MNQQRRIPLTCHCTDSEAVLGMPEAAGGVPVTAGVRTGEAGSIVSLALVTSQGISFPLCSGGLLLLFLLLSDTIISWCWVCSYQFDINSIGHANCLWIMCILEFWFRCVCHCMLYFPIFHFGYLFLIYMQIAPFYPLFLEVPGSAKVLHVYCFIDESVNDNKVVLFKGRFTSFLLNSWT